MVCEKQIGCVISVEDEDNRKQFLGLNDRVDNAFEVNLYCGFDVIVTDDTRQSAQILCEEVSLHHSGFILYHELLYLFQA